jgi:hypothetical protein
LGRLKRPDEEPEDKEVMSLLENVEKVLGKFDRGMSISAACFHRGVNEWTVFHRVNWDRSLGRAKG